MVNREVGTGGGEGTDRDISFFHTLRRKRSKIFAPFKGGSFWGHQWVPLGFIFLPLWVGSYHQEARLHHVVTKLDFFSHNLVKVREIIPFLVLYFSLLHKVSRFLEGSLNSWISTVGQWTGTLLWYKHFSCKTLFRRSRTDGDLFYKRCVPQDYMTGKLIQSMPRSFLLLSESVVRAWSFKRETVPLTHKPGHRWRGPSPPQPPFPPTTF